MWIRAARLQPKGEPSRLYNGIEPSDIMQGSLGDCWLLSALAAVAEFPEYIEDRMVVERGLNKDGKYCH